MSRKNTSIRLFLIIFIFTTIGLSAWAISINFNNAFNLSTEQESVLYDFQNKTELKNPLKSSLP